MQGSFTVEAYFTLFSCADTKQVFITIVIMIMIVIVIVVVVVVVVIVIVIMIIIMAPPPTPRHLLGILQLCPPQGGVFAVTGQPGGGGGIVKGNFIFSILKDVHVSLF